MADVYEHPFGSKKELKGAVELWWSNKQRAIDIFGEIANWNVSAVDDMSDLFNLKRRFNENLSAWDTSSVTSMKNMFHGCNFFKSDLSAWDTSSVTDMSCMFGGCEHFESDLSAWNTSSVTNMGGMFYECKVFNSDLSQWDTSSVTNMICTFYDASSFNSNISKWVIPAERVDRSHMLKGATAFKDGVGSEAEFAMQKEASKRNYLKQRKIEKKTKIQEEEEEEVLPAANSEEHNNIGKDVIKYAAIFPVYSGRNHLDPQKEARDMEEQLVKVGYTLWRHEAGYIGKEPPSTYFEHIQDFNQWLQQKKKDNDIDGVFVMVIAHGKTSQGGGDARQKPKIKLEDIDNFDVELWMTDHLAGTTFPVILAMSCCRVDDQKFSIPALVLKLNNIFVSWGAVNGNRMEDGRFVENWRLFIGSGDFMKEEIGAVNKKVLRNCGGGEYDDGLDTSKRCIGGVWFNDGHLVSDITAEEVQDRINGCINYFSTAPWGKKFKELKWEHSGTIQGKYTAVFEGNLIAILCSQVQTMHVQGIIYHQGQDSNEHIEYLLKQINKIQITDKTPKKCNSIEQFMKTTSFITNLI